MKVKVQSNENSMTLELLGKIDYESPDEVFKVIAKTLEERKSSHDSRPLYIDWDGLEFVGSAGISQFVKKLRALHNRFDCAPQYINVNTSFQKMIQVFDPKFSPPQQQQYRKPPTQ